MQEQISLTATISPPVVWFWPIGTSENMLMQDFFADKVDRGQKSGFFLASSALGYKPWNRARDRREKRSIHPERNSTHLGIWAVRSNKCIGLIIKDSLNEDGCYPLKAQWFHKPDLNSDVVVITVWVPHWLGDKSPYHYYTSLDNSYFILSIFVIHFPYLR